MNPDEFICARPECGVVSVKKTHNQKYCTDDCCKLATNQRLKENYYENKDRIRGVRRWCSHCHKTKLSRYNETKICSSCKEKRKSDANISALAMIMNYATV